MLDKNNIAAERKATPHTALLIPRWRNKTGLHSGNVPAQESLSRFTFEMISDNEVSRSKMQLLDETPFYEIAFCGQVFRMLSRPRASEAIPTDAGQWPRDSDKYELVRTVAPGLKQDGTYLAVPDAVPNTPRALMRELVTVTGTSIAELLADAYSIFHSMARYGLCMRRPMAPRPNSGLSYYERWTRTSLTACQHTPLLAWLELNSANRVLQHLRKHYASGARKLQRSRR